MFLLVYNQNVTEYTVNRTITRKEVADHIKILQTLLWVYS